ncbi:hypothetical protein [Chromobacterium haemolyticum]|uniref:hypothetical protein n=1 Tax=Chromobacterium haemolyticum TaxID=394935 RepID=UPI001C6265B6|nr:hypothetical protein [Chromobacterium haemolyticum]
MMKMALALVLVSAALVGCATGEKMSSLRPGMTRTEVVSILGEPDGFKAEGDSAALKYSHRLASGWAWDRADYFVILKDGRVTEYGQGEVRVKQNNTMVIVPLR